LWPKERMSDTPSQRWLRRSSGFFLVIASSEWGFGRAAY
jgi:hypothetical protein